MSRVLFDLITIALIRRIVQPWVGACHQIYILIRNQSAEIFIPGDSVGCPADSSMQLDDGEACLTKLIAGLRTGSLRWFTSGRKMHTTSEILLR